MDAALNPKPKTETLPSVEVALDAGLSKDLTAGARRAALLEALEQAAIQAAGGRPNALPVTLAPAPAGTPFLLRVAGTRLRYPAELLARVLELSGRVAPSGGEVASGDNLWKALLHDLPPPEERIALIAALVREILARDARRACNAGRVALAGKRLAPSHAKGAHGSPASESLQAGIAGLGLHAEPRIELRVNPDYLYDLVQLELEQPISFGELGSAASRGIAEMREVLFYLLGVRLPEVRVAPATDLPEHEAEVRVAGLAGARYRTLSPDQVLVGRPPEFFKSAGIAPPPRTNPATGKRCSLLTAQQLAQTGAAGLEKWNAVEFLILMISAEARANAGCLVTLDSVHDELAKLHAAFPDLVLAALQYLSPEDLVRALRSLLAERVSIRDLRGILGAALEIEQVVGDFAGREVYTSGLAIDRRWQPLYADGVVGLVQRARMVLAGAIFEPFVKNGRLRAGRLDAELERRLLEHALSDAGGTGRRLDGAEIERVCDLLAATLSAADAPDVVITSMPVRALVSEWVQAERATAVVTCREELPPDIAPDFVCTLSAAAVGLSDPC